MAMASSIAAKIRSLAASGWGGADTPARRLLHDGSVPDEKLVNFFSYFLDLPVLAKQGLLQRRSLAERAVALIEAVDFSLAGCTWVSAAR